ncbi:MarR family winged helix-turn-helix transcriptional regulator [Halalkalibacter alkaliphilus]|jgi:DNA-binding MarR family transcriptional regulator|uniref:MarR family winged helix-turn-helix transcriptional regulator n=1 Tax=Halalkalibacter alkaliphilus TaxID=2917993 RepID=A0A9X2CS51_9BACI|nr:MarR family winged helix-turn-helix transcriptional regulator [Halalkalibacter alkaliphilus]MCL7747074.1 MarR family winged helix-turn-helix transcriptional regulator [Halalkalibacter alkaliphilus]
MGKSKYILAESIGYKITNTARLITNRLNKNFKQNNLPVTHEQWAIMIRLWEEDGLTQNNLAEMTKKDSPSISRLINNMEKRDLVTRIPHPVDKRTNLIFLTATGKKMQMSMIEQAQNTVDQISNGIEKEEMEIFLKVLRKIDQNLSD